MMGSRHYGLLPVTVLLWVLTACVYNPTYDGALCSDDGDCPEGFTCVNSGGISRCFQGQAADGEEEPGFEDGDDGLPDAGDPGPGDPGPGDPGPGDPDDDQDAGDPGPGDPDEDQDAGDPGPDCEWIDFDQDGHFATDCGGDDCDDTRGDVYPGADELCDNIDNDCDDATDGMSRDCAEAHMGACAMGTETCTEGVWAGCPAAGDELCDPAGVDEDCDGSIDEECTGCTESEVKDCPLQEGVCAGAQSVCVNGEWSACDYLAHSQGSYEPPPESSCDGLDNDCDGTTDGISRRCDQNHLGICSVGVETCVAADTWEGCPLPGQETCDQHDNDCDDLTDLDDPDLFLPPCELDLGVCAGPWVHDPGKCVQGAWHPCDQTEYGPTYSDEVCTDGLDNDCNGSTDCEEAICDGTSMECWNQCHPGTQTCADGAWTDCNAAGVDEERETNGNCDDGIDNDCDGRTDGEEDRCCGTMGVPGSLLVLLMLPLGILWQRKRWG